MTETILAHEPAIRLSFFLAMFLIIALWELFGPRRRQTVSRWVRWSNNLALTAFNTLLLRVVVPVSAIGLAVEVEANQWGLLNQLQLPVWLDVWLSVLLLDAAIYLQHLTFHAVPALWRLHRMHHADLDLDVTTGTRFHPLEIFLSWGFKLLVVAALGVPVLAVLIFEVLLNVTSMFNHGNIRIPLGFDRWLRWFVVTPDMHRVHHSVIPEETNSNFGFNLPWWDRLFGTYRNQPASGHEAMTIGTDQFRSHRDLRLDQLLIQPFRGDVGVYPISNRAASSSNRDE